MKKKTLIFFLVMIFSFTGSVAGAFWPWNSRTLEKFGEKNVEVVDNEMVFECQTEADTVKSLLEKEGIKLNEKDLIYPAVETELTPGLKIFIQRAVLVRIDVDQTQVEDYVIARTVGEAIEKMGVPVSHLDKISPNKDALLDPENEVTIVRIEIEEVELEESIEFSTIEKEDDDLKWRKTKVKQEGENGFKKVKYRITYKNGKQSKKEKLSSEIIKEPVPEIISIGTKIEVGKTKTGLASWYAYTNTMACASRMFPKGTWLRVTNLANKKQIFVQVNDYGPMRGTGKMIDLDKVAFEKLASLGQGVIEVKVEEIVD